MNYLKKFIKNPIVWLLVIVLAASFYNNAYKSDIQYVIRSDGRGYYAFLPAAFIYNDPSFEKVISIEKEVCNTRNQIYLHKDENGKTYNKYFPGIAVLQIPFFVLACILSFFLNQPVDGYSDLFHYLFLFGSFFYFALGIIFFNKTFKHRFPDIKKQVPWLIIIITFASPLFFYLLQGTSISHLYSFGLFGLYSYAITLLIKKQKASQYFILGLLLGLIFLLRPTNLLIILVIPLFFDSWKDFLSLLKITFANRARLLITAILGFLIPASILLLSWKWQTGHWIVWSYSGEGFNFLNPKFIETLFSYRIGLYLHTPILILSLISLMFLIRKRMYLLTSYLVYFLMITWVISSWWCWDYESQFGSRPFIEHMFFLMIPVFLILKKYKNILYPFMLLCALLGIFRIAQWYTGVVPEARYDSNSYWDTLSSFGEDQEGRWNFTRSCHPYGTLVSSDEVFSHIEEFSFTDEIEYGLPLVLELPKPRTNEWYYYSVQLEKRHDLDQFEDVFLVADARSEGVTERYYYTFDLYNDREEGKGEWSKPLIFEGIIYDNFQEYDEAVFYIWNKGKIAFDIRNVKYTVSVYKSDE